MTAKEFAFKQLDKEGMETLEAIAGAPAFNEWMYKTISKNMTGRTLEIGSGIGNISDFFIRDKRQIVLSDIRDNYCNYLKVAFGEEPTVEDIVNLDLVHPDFDKVYAKFLGSFDSVFALNVVEHIKDDNLAIANCKKLLRNGGRLVILVPAYQALYNKFDEALEHYRRYNKTMLQTLFLNNGFKITNSQYFNLAAIAGWYVSGNLLKKETIPSGQMKLYNALVPIFKLADKVFLNKIGISVIVEGIKE